MRVTPPPSASSCSTTMTSRPCHAAVTAADNPEAPDPTTSKSHCRMVIPLVFIVPQQHEGHRRERVVHECGHSSQRLDAELAVVFGLSDHAIFAARDFQEILEGLELMIAIIELVKNQKR